MSRRPRPVEPNAPRRPRSMEEWIHEGPSRVVTRGELFQVVTYLIQQREDHQARVRRARRLHRRLLVWLGRHYLALHARFTRRES